MLRIVDASAGDALLQVRMLFREYVDSVGIDVCFQGFTQELATLPGDYVRPGGRLLLGLWDGEAAGCVALRALQRGICEMKRLYVRPQYRNFGVGGALVERIIGEAIEAGYAAMRLDSLPSMGSAIGLYRRLGFRDIDPYTENPIPGAVFLELPLAGQTTA